MSSFAEGEKLTEECPVEGAVVTDDNSDKEQSVVNSVPAPGTVIQVESPQHPLCHQWVLWEHKQLEKDENWSNSIRRVCEFGTVEEFWRYWSFIPRPSEIFFDGQSRKVVEGRMIEGFSLFKRGIRPEWEDVANKSGSELSCRKSLPVDILDLYWENMAMGLIGETIDDGDEICGCRVVDKGKATKPGSKTLFKLELWMRKDNVQIAERLRHRLCEHLADGEGLAHGKKSRHIPDFEYKKH